MPITITNIDAPAGYSSEAECEVYGCDCTEYRPAEVKA
jgi:hypothetical protein